MIPDLIRTHKIRHYIFEQTGVWVARGRIKKLLDNGEIARLQPSGKSDKWTTKSSVDAYIRRHIG